MDSDFTYRGAAFVTLVERQESVGEAKVSLWNPITGLKVTVTISDPETIRRFEECVCDPDRMVSVDLEFRLL